MSQDSNENGTRPHRTFQRTNISSYTESRRQRFLSLRKQNRELYFEKARKIALDGNDNNNNNNNNNKNNNNNNSNTFDFTFDNNKIHFHNDFDTDALPTNKYKQFPPKSESKINNKMEFDSNNNNPSPKSGKRKRRKKKKKNKQQINTAEQRELRMKYVQMFMVHEWMIDIPKDLAQNWLVGLRAEGERCLVYSTNGRTVSRNRTGNYIHNGFPSSLPCGNYIQQKKSFVTILDCIYICSIKTYYVIDCILWNDQKIGCSDASFRLWFMKSKLNECLSINKISKYNKYRFVPIEIMDVNAKNLNYLYNGGNLVNNNQNKEEKKMENESQNNDRINKPKMHPDGLIFYHKNGCYVSGESCPLILVWKDNIISRWFIDTSNRQNKNKLLQFITLQLQNDSTITTYENDIILGNMSMEQIQKHNFKPKQLLRFSITNAIMNECKVNNLLYTKKASSSKMQADTWSKIVFQHQAKNNCSVSFKDIINYISNNKNNIESIDDQLRVATLGLSNFHL